MVSQPGNEISLYKRVGRTPGIRIAVDRFYERVRGFFEDLGTERLKAHQLSFLLQILGGPRQYCGTWNRSPFTWPRPFANWTCSRKSYHSNKLGAYSAGRADRKYTKQGSVA